MGNHHRFRKSGIRSAFFFVLAALFISALASLARGAEPWTPAQIIQPEELPRQLANSQEKPLVLYVGFQRLYEQAHIPGAPYCGPASKPEGLEKLAQCAQKVPRSKEIVIYCGCCPWDDCPNIRPAFTALRKMGFERLKVLYIPHNLGADWVQKGFPVEPRQPRQ